MKIRKARRSEWPVIADIHVESWQDAYGNVLPEQYIKNHLAVDIGNRWINQRTTSEDLILVADDGNLVGFITVWCRPDPFIDNLHVKPACRSKNIGRALMKAAARELVLNGKKRAYLWVFVSNRSAIRFYERLGGVKKEIAQKNIFGTMVPSVKMVWDDISIVNRL